MAAFSAVVSFEHILNHLVDSDKLPMDDLSSLHKKVSSLQKHLADIFPAPQSVRDNAKALGDKIRDQIYKAQDDVEAFVFAQSLPPESRSSSSSSISLKGITKRLDPFIKEAQDLADQIIREGKKHSPPADEQTFKFSQSTRPTRIIGQDEDKKSVMQQLMRQDEGKRDVLPISGMAGIGKTTLARSIYEDKVIQSHFPYRAWVTVSQDANIGDILAKLLSSIESRGKKAGETKYQGTEETLREKLHQELHNNKYLVVVDDMWEKEVWEKLQLSLPDNRNGSRVLLTTRLKSIVTLVKSTEFAHEMQPLNEDFSWELLCERTFGGMHCPPQLEKTGREISKNCRGLPLSITVIGGLLSQGAKTDEYWVSIKDDIHAATKGADDEQTYQRILSLSYDYLPVGLKACFLYMGAFPEDSEITVPRLVKLWVAEDFLELPTEQMPPVEGIASKSMADLIDRNLVLIRKRSTNGWIKACGLHDSLRDLATHESGKDMFFHSRKKYKQKPEENTNTQRRISVHKNILMCLEEVYNSTKEIEKSRSLLYVGDHHHHPMPFILTFDLLRVLDAYTCYFIEFPYDFLTLVHLRYISFTYNGKIPSKIAELKKLQVLMVHREPKIIFVGIPYLPDELWEMKELRHLITTESDLPLLSDEKAQQSFPVLDNLQTLGDINAASCNEKVLENMPNLTKLSMWIESPKTVDFHLYKLNKLEIFKFIVLNPIPGKKIDLQPRLYFPDTVRKLNLSGCGLPWEDMEIIALLPNLEVLKLRELAFHGDEWAPTSVFEKLKFLLIEYLNLKSWDTDGSHYPSLIQLIFRHCYDLEYIPIEFGELANIELIELVDCSPEAVESAEDIKKKQEEFGDERLRVNIYSSWE